MTHLRTTQVAVAVSSLALLVFDLAGWMGPDKPEWAIAIAGGDTDTNAGAALGARFGLAAIPNRWRNAVTELRQDRTPLEYYAGQVLAQRAAARLC